MDSETEIKSHDDLERQGRFNFSERVLIWSCVTIAFVSSFLCMVLVFGLDTPTKQLLPVVVVSLVFLLCPLMLRIGVKFSVVRMLFFGLALASVAYLSTNPDTSTIMAFLNFLPIFILLAGMMFSTRGVLVFSGLSTVVIVIAGAYAYPHVPEGFGSPIQAVGSIGARHFAAVLFATTLVIVAMKMFRELLDKLRDARDKEQSLSLAKTEFLASMSHEVRTPLNAIIGMAEILRTNNLPEEERRQVDTIAEAGHALLEMLSQVLDASRLEADQMSVSPEPTDMGTFFEGLLRLWAPIAEQKGIAFRMEIDPAIPDSLDLDPLRLRQCMNNLLSNAVKFTDQGFILLSAKWDVRDGSPDRLLVEVTDTGIGMAPDAANRIFAPFEQADKTIERAYGGSGLGLSITRGLARLMGGDLSFKSVAGEGSIFTLVILGVATPDETEEAAMPLAPYSLPYTDDDSEDEENAAELESKTGPFRAIVADDLATNRYIAVSYLQNLGVEAIEVENGADAVAIARDEPQIDLILLDRHMPDTDGIWALKQLKSDPDLRHIPVVIFTAGLSEQDMRHCLNLGASEVLIKPFTIARIRELVDRIRVENNPACAEGEQ